MEHLAERMSAFQAGEERLLILFRHVAKEDAPVMARLLVREFPRWCRERGIKLSSPPHAHFLYGKDVLNWAGAGARWLFPRIGGIPVVNTRVDRASQGTMRRLLVEGDFPLCFAPEGQVTYHMFRTSDPAPGTATLAGWTLKDLKARGGSSSRDYSSGGPWIPAFLGSRGGGLDSCKKTQRGAWPPRFGGTGA